MKLYIVLNNKLSILIKIFPKIYKLNMLLFALINEKDTSCNIQESDRCFLNRGKNRIVLRRLDDSCTFEA